MLAEKHPLAPRAQHDLANALLSAAGPPFHRDSPLLRRAQRALESAMTLSKSSIFPEHRLISIAAVLNEPIQERWWESIIHKLRRYPPEQADIDALTRLMDCEADKVCPRQTKQLFSAFVAAIFNSRGSPALLVAYARFAADELGDLELAERMARKAISLDPDTARWRMNLIRYLILSKRWEAAQEQLAKLQRLNHIGFLDQVIAEFERQLDLVRPAGPESKVIDSPP